MKPVPPVRVSPRRLLLYSMPKVGKTEMLAQLPSCLILDADPDEGAGLYECMRQEIRSIDDVNDVIEAIEAEGTRRIGQGLKGFDVYPYRFLAADPLDRFELFCEWSATEKYKKGPLNSGGKFEKNGYKSVIELPEGAGYLHLRNEMTAKLDAIAGRCTNAIYTAHVKEKKMGGKDEKTGEQAVVQDIDLAGKLGSIICASVDAIGYVYRNQDKEYKGELWISFQTNDSAVMGARQKYLAGQKMPFTWDRIYPDLIERDEKTGLYSLIGKKELVA